MPATLIRTDDELAVSLSDCRGSEFGDSLAKIKDIPGRRFDGERKLWILPNEPAAAERAIYALGAHADQEVHDWVRAARQQREAELATKLPEDADLLVPWAREAAPWQPSVVNGEPYEGLKQHQRVAVDLMAAHKRMILADDMGLGKTLQMISAVVEVCLREERDYTAAPKLIVCPNSVKGVWAREIHRWLGDEEPVQILDATTKNARRNQLVNGIADNAWVIANYEQLRIQKHERKLRNGGTKTEWVLKEPLFGSTEWLAVIGDEIHRAKNRKAAQTRGLWLARGDIMFGASGTPMMNEPAELWAILRWLWPEQYNSNGKGIAYWSFFEMYVEYIEGYFGKVITGVKNPDALRFELQNRLIRRTKNEVLDLPEKVRITIPVTLDAKQRKVYREAETKLWLEIEREIEEGDPSGAATPLAAAAVQGKSVYMIPNGAARTVRLRQVLSTPALLGGEDHSAKLDAVVDKITDNAHKQHVVYSEFVGTCHALAERLRKYKLDVETYTGETDQRQRASLEDAFQAGEINVIIGTLGAMREGITLTAADTVHFVERSWVPGWNEQAEDRLHRIGQANHVTVYIYEAEDTVDDGKVAPTNRLKERIVRTVLPQDEIREAAPA